MIPVLFYHFFSREEPFLTNNFDVRLFWQIITPRKDQMEHMVG